MRHRRCMLPKNGGPGVVGNQYYTIGDVTTLPLDADNNMVLTIEQELEAAYGNNVNFDVLYERVDQARWQQTTDNNNWFVATNNGANAATIDAGPPAMIITNGITTSGNGHNNFGDRLIIRVTITLNEADTSGVELPLNDNNEMELVTYICVKLP